MRKWFIWLIVVALLFAICGCDKEVDEVLAETETVCPTAEATEPTTPVYDSIEYWEIVHDEMVSMLNEHNLYVAAINSNYPCVLYEVEPGIQTADGQIVASGLTQEEYEGLYHHIKEEYWTDTLIIWYHRSMASVAERNRWSKWLGFAFGSGLHLLKNERMLFTFQKSYVNLKRREPWLLEKGR